MLGIGIDTGGTCTDAVIYDTSSNKILACAKADTTHEHLETGIRNALLTLPRDLIDRASYISLSTTLATNACVESKGGRVCMLFIGADEKIVREDYKLYGFEGTDFIRFLDGDPKKDLEPDWDLFESMLPEILSQYDSIAISQFNARENNGDYEKEAKRRILAKKQLPVVCAFEIFKDLNVIKRGAGALLNARLIPVMEGFFAAVHHVLDEEHIPLPFMIMRSDGSLVSEEYSMQFPVETLLCGPTASVKGGTALMKEDNAVIIDMGGTTSDIVLVKNGEPVFNNEGVRVGSWQTFVRGIEIDTFALGGDSLVKYKTSKLWLDDRRVLPISLLAVQHPQCLAELTDLSETLSLSALPLYEHFVLMQDISGREDLFTERELKIVELLKQGPMSIRQISKALDVDAFFLNTDRLEKEVIIMRSGMTPTDAMILKGDRTDLFPDPSERFDSTAYKAAACAAKYILRSLNKDAARTAIADQIYYLVKEKLYLNLVRILWSDGRTKAALKKFPASLMDFARESFAKEMQLLNSSEKPVSFYKNIFSTDAVLLGVGAPIHVFLDDVAKALHTTCRVSDYSGVCNALGAVLGNVRAIETIYIKLESGLTEQEGELLPGGYVVYGDKKDVFQDFDDAVSHARKIAIERARKKAIAYGAVELADETVSVKEIHPVTNYGDMLLGAEITAQVEGSLIKE